MAWFRPMGADEVEYHRSTVLERSDDHPGAALAYYGSRGETPLRWAGNGAAHLGPSGEVTAAGYDLAFGPGGFRHPDTGAHLVGTRRPGFELVVSAHKSVAVLGVMDRADEMHAILDVETKATMDWLDGWFAERGGRRGRVQERTETGGLVYAVTRHATSRAGDPSPHDHVLVANVVEMLDARGGFKALDSAALRDTVEAATMVGRLHSAARTVELGFRIEADDGPSGNLRHWRVAGIPQDVCEVFSKRSDEILEHLEKTGLDGYRARGLAARATRIVKRHTGAEELLPRWRAEITAVGWQIERLATATSALETQGYRVLGTSTSGQATRTLGAEAQAEARTFASMLWRLDHGQITLDDRTVVVVDEAGMADDANLARLVLAVERSGASLVLVGDHRQLSAVGPGGALAALLERHPDLVVTLNENVRQRDPGEREALAMLRDGEPADAVAWCADHGRSHFEGTRVETLVAMTDAWARDVDAGYDTALLAWRRQDVADLNRLARDRWDRSGHLHGDDVEVHPGRWYAPGDRLVALAPNPQAGIVTSEPLQVLAVTEEAMTVRTADVRTVTLTGDGLGAEHLDYGYALTVHRSQGATYDRAHVLAAGGGRELGYVACSRARDTTTLYATADDLGQAVDDLRADWGATRAQRWVTTTRAQPGVEAAAVTVSALEKAAMREPAAAVAAVDRLGVARARLAALEHDYDDLLAGGGRWKHTAAGAAARTV